MASIDLGGTLKALKGERARMHQDLAKLIKAITMLEGLFVKDSTSPNGHAGKTDSVRRDSQENREGSEVALGKAKAASRQEVEFEQDYLNI